MVKCDTLLDSWKWRILKVQFFQWIGRTKKIGATEKLSRVSSITNKGMGEFPILSNYSATRSILGTFITHYFRFPFVSVRHRIFYSEVITSYRLENANLKKKTVALK